MQWEPNGSNGTQVVGTGTKTNIDGHVRHKLEPGDDYSKRKNGCKLLIVSMQTSW